ncbi:MAG: hypothetical protein FHK82_16860 [Sedimenticola thiotaurini]|uniref:Immunity MXAN-0049 protein domain-containing protein n=1 Tax=Sedimenticola thiotaurini TaxID=1543721 RepID=A0A558CM59_9GAMM|nr:MAG: hypothetical protein FHK82_16860 [Sedimenticola thiotaurini]
MRYFLLHTDTFYPNKWVLGDVRHVDNWSLTNPTPYFMEPGTYTIDVYQDGEELDYNENAAYAVPVLSRKARDSLIGLPEIDEPYHHVVLEPLIIEGRGVAQDYFVMIIETQVDCVDEVRSEFQKYQVNDPVRPDRAGEYRSFFNLVIDPTKIGDHHIFRLKRHLGSVIVSEEVKRRFEEAGVKGAVFESVNGDKQTVG